MPQFLFKPTPHNEAIDFIRSKPVVSREVFDQLLPELQARAFTISGLVPADVMQTVRDLIADLPAGQPFETQKKLIAQTLSPYLDEKGAAAKAELLLRVHGQEAYASAADAVMRRQIAIFPNWEYRTMGDSKVRASHRALNGLIVPADSPFWDTHNPPWEWGCRCIKIPISDSSLQDILKSEPERVLVNDRARLTNLEKNNVIERFDPATGARKFVDVAPAGTFQFDPQSLTLSVDELRARYSPEVWNSFEAWARRTEISADAEGRTVWNWINGEPGAPEVASVTDKILPARKSPVSDAFAIRVRDRAFRSELESVIEAIDQTHDDGAIPDLEIRTGRSRRALGEFKISKDAVEVKPGGPWRRLTLAHETGHVLDYYGIGERAKFASAADPALAAWRAAIDNSAAIRTLQGDVAISNRPYFLQRREEFARSYAQYIAYKTQDAGLMADVERVRKLAGRWRQWSWDDFAPIAKAFDDFFATQGWIP